MRAVPGHVPVFNENPSKACSGAQSCCSLYVPSAYGVGPRCLGVSNGPALEYSSYPCYDGSNKTCMYAEATPENIARSVEWRLTR